MTRCRQITLFMLTITASASSWGDGSNVGKIYTPYVQQLEKELEYEFVFQNDDRASFDDYQTHRFAYGQSLSDDWLFEFGLTGRNTPDTGFKISAYEIEVKWQLTEQGEFDNDWALLFELENQENPDIWEFGSTLIVLHQWKKWVGTANLSIAYETGETIDDEVETGLATQLKYRYKAAFEPGIEYFKNENTNALGPSIGGQFRLGGRKKLFWGAGFAFSLDRSKPDSSFRANIEYEF